MSDWGCVQSGCVAGILHKQRVGDIVFITLGQGPRPSESAA
jgi:hypothetical protein